MKLKYDEHCISVGEDKLRKALREVMPVACVVSYQCTRLLIIRVYVTVNDR